MITKIISIFAVSLYSTICFCGNLSNDEVQINVGIGTNIYSNYMCSKASVYVDDKFIGSGNVSLAHPLQVLYIMNATDKEIEYTKEIKVECSSAAAPYVSAGSLTLRANFYIGPLNMPLPDNPNPHKDDFHFYANMIKKTPYGYMNIYQGNFTIDEA